MMTARLPSRLGHWRLTATGRDLSYWMSVPSRDGTGETVYAGSIGLRGHSVIEWLDEFVAHIRGRFDSALSLLDPGDAHVRRFALDGLTPTGEG